MENSGSKPYLIQTRHNDTQKNDRPTNILVADDDHVLRAVATMTLDAREFTVSEAGNGRQALDIIDANPVDLVLLDLGMPVMDGFGVLQQIRKTEKFRHIPVIVITGMNDSAAIEKAFALGATSFVTKPLDWTILTHHIRFVLKASRLEATEREARETAENLSQVKGHLLSIISHEFRTPMNAITGFSRLAEHKIEGMCRKNDFQDVSGYMADIRQATERLDDMMSDILLLSSSIGKTLALTEESWLLEEILQTAVARVKEKAGTKNIKVIFDARGFEECEILCDHELTGRALCHLMNNAISFSSPDSMVFLQVCRTQDGGARFSIIDQGSGMSVPQLDSALQPFSQSDMSFSRSVEGLGLGLTVSKMVMEHHDGKLELLSSEGKGTIASLTFPPGRLCNNQNGDMCVLAS